jgi:hypothetical protein
MTDAGAIESWGLRIDDCLGQAARVLRHATERLIQGALDVEDAEAASTLAEAWRDLAADWRDRQEGELGDDEEAAQADDAAQDMAAEVV